MADNKDVQYNFTGSTEGLKSAADSAIQILGNVSKAESNMAGMGSQSLAAFNSIKNVTSLISSDIASIQKQMKSMGTLALPAPQQPLALPPSNALVPIQNSLVPVQQEMAKVTQEATSMSGALTGSRMSNAISVFNGISNAVAQMRSMIQSSAATSQSAIDEEAQAFTDVNWRAVDASEGKQRFARSNEEVNNSANRSAGGLGNESRAFNILKTVVKGIMAPITATVKGLEMIGKGAKSLISHLGGMSSATSIAKSALQTLTGYASGDLFGNAIRQSIDFVESMEMFQVACRNSMDVASDFVNQMQEMYGLDPKSIMDSTAYFYQLTAAIEAPAEASEKMSLGLTKLSTDLASLFNMDVEKVSNNLSSGIQGMSRAVTKYGMDIRKTTLQEYAAKLGIQQKVSEMSEASRQGLRYIAMMNQARAANGNWAKTIESAANQLRVFKEQMAQLGRSIGDFFTPALARILPVVNGIIMAIRTVLTYISAFVRLFKPKSFNDTASAVNKAAGAYSNLGSAAGGAGKKAKKAAKEASKSVAAFDQINKLDGEDKDTDTGGGAGGGGGGGIDMDGVMDPAILNAINDIDTSLDNVRMKANDVRDSILKFLGFTSESGDFSIKFNYDTNEWETDIKWSAEQFKKNLIDKFPNWKQTINSIFSNWDDIITSFKNLWKTAGESIGLLVSPVKTALATMFSDENMANFFNNLSGYIDSVSGVLSNLAIAMAPVVEGFANGLAGLSPVFSSIGSAIKQISEALIPAGQALGPVVEQMMLMAGNSIASGIQVIADIVSKLASETLPLLAPLLSAIISGMGSLHQAMLPLVGDILKTLIDVINTLIPVVTNVVQSIMPALQSVITAILPMLNQLIQAVLPPIANLIGQLMPMIISIVQTVLPPLLSLLDSIMQPLIRIIEQVLPIICSLIAEVMDPITQMINQTMPPLLSLLQAIIEPVMNIVERLLPPLVKLLKNILVPIIRVVAAVIGAVIAILAPCIEAIIQVADVILSVLVAGIEIVIDIINAVIEVIGACIKVIVDVFNQIVKTVSNILNTISDMIAKLVSWFRNLINMIGDWIDSVIKTVTEFFTHIIEGAGAFCKGVWDVVDSLVKVVLDFLKGLWDGIMSVLNDIKTGFDTAWNAIWNIISGIVSSIGDTIGNLIGTIGGLLSYVSDKFYNGWKTAWNGIKNFVTGIWDSITGAIKSAINVVIKALNTMIRGANKLSFDIPDWVPGLGGKKFGLNIPLIPTLAGGGLLNAGQLFIANEAGPELVGNVGSRTAVLNNDQIVEAVARGVERANQNVVRAIKESKGGSPKLVVDKRVLAQVVTEAINDYGRSLGYSTVGLR